MSAAKHTPGQKYQTRRRFNDGTDAADGSGGAWQVVSDDGLLCENCSRDEAELIVRSLNAAPALVEALKDLLHSDGTTVVAATKKAIAALAAAGVTP